MNGSNLQLKWLSGVVLATALINLSAEELPEISLQAIKQYAITDYSKEEMMNTSIELGIHNGVLVLADYPCIDICPENTVQMIRYDMPLDKCAAAGGTIISELIPWAMGQIVQEYCSPIQKADLNNRRP